jgi:hypothetical protein
VETVAVKPIGSAGFPNHYPHLFESFQRLPVDSIAISYVQSQVPKMPLVFGFVENPNQSRIRGFPFKWDRK